MKAVSIKQPWAYLIAAGIKDIENRTWKPHFRGRIYIHVSGKASGKLPDVLTNKQADFITCNVKKMPPNVKNMDYSAIIGEVDIIDCVINHPSIWAEKSDVVVRNEDIYKPIYNWVLANPVLYDKPILNVKGKLSFWYPDTDIVECIGCSQKFDSETMEEDDGGEKFCIECWKELSLIMIKEYDELKAKGEIE